VTLPGHRYEVSQGSVLLQSDSSAGIFFLESGSPHKMFAGDWRSDDNGTITLAVHTVMGGRNARGAGRISFRPDGSVQALRLNGRADGGEFSARFENQLGVATAAGHDPVQTGSRAQAQPHGDQDDWAGDWFIFDVTRRGDGRLSQPERGDYEFDRARLTLGGNGEFVLVMGADPSYKLAGTWSGDPRFSPIDLEVREAFGSKVAGFGRAWIREQSWDRDWSFERVELDGWGDGGRFAMYFDTGAPHSRTLDEPGDIEE
jgi:hypothetical protein